MLPRIDGRLDDRRREQRLVRWFFAGLLAISAALDIIGALLVQHQTRDQLLASILPDSITLGGRTGVVLAGLALLLLARGVSRGKKVAWRLTLVVLVASIGLDLVKDLDVEDAVLAAWILIGLWWMRHHFQAESDPSSVRWGLIALGGGLALAAAYAVGGATILGHQLTPEVGISRTISHLAATLIRSPSIYRGLSARANWFLGSLPYVSYALVLIALARLLRPVLAPRTAAVERASVRQLLAVWGRNHIARLAAHAAVSYHWPDDQSCIAFSLQGRTALALGDPIGPPSEIASSVADFVAFCDRQDWIPAFYQVDDREPYRSLGFTLVPIGSEAVVQIPGFTLEGKNRHDLRYSLGRCERAGIQFRFMRGPEALATLADQLRTLSGRWLNSHHAPELGYSLGTLATLSDDDIFVGAAVASNGRLEAFVSWLPVPARNSWTLDLMRRQPDAAYGVMEALIVKSIQEATARGVTELSLGLAPRTISPDDAELPVSRAVKAMYWGLDRFQRGTSLRRFKAKFGPLWQERYLAAPGPSALPEVLIALIRVHLPPARALAVRLRTALAA